MTESACRARSAAEFFAKICICIEEADEALRWLELLGDAGIVPEEKLTDIKEEFLAILAVLAKSRKTLSDEKRQ